MHTPQLASGVLVLALASTAACSREETRQEAREAASEARAAAARAGDQLADGWLTTKIQAQYFADDDVKARHINVTTRDGVVALTGLVNDGRARAQAVQIARNTDGVRDVVDRLTIASESGGAFDSVDARPHAGGDARAIDGNEIDAGAVPTSGAEPEANAGRTIVTLDDASIASRIQAKYFVDESVKSRYIEVVTRDGVVTLRGEVASDAERAQALLLARTTEGVQRVEDSLAVNASLTPGAPPAP